MTSTISIGFSVPQIDRRCLPRLTPLVVYELVELREIRSYSWGVELSVPALCGIRDSRVESNTRTTHKLCEYVRLRWQTHRSNCLSGTRLPNPFQDLTIRTARKECVFQPHQYTYNYIVGIGIHDGSGAASYSKRWAFFSLQRRRVTIRWPPEGLHSLDLCGRLDLSKQGSICLGIDAVGSVEVGAPRQSARRIGCPREVPPGLGLFSLV